MRKHVVQALVAVLFLFSGVVRAQWEDSGSIGGGTDDGGPVVPLSLKDMSCVNKAEVSFPMVPGENFFGMAPLLRGQYGVGDTSVGFTLPLAVAVPEEGDSTTVLGNLTLDFKFRGCTEGKWSVCFGGAVDLALGFVELSEDLDGLEEAAAHLIGQVAHQDVAYHYPERMIIRPLAVFMATNGEVFVQAEFGSAATIPLVNTDGRDPEWMMQYAFALGYKYQFVSAMAEFKNFMDMMWINFGARLQFDNILPGFRIAVPIDEMAQLTADVHFEVGTIVRF